MNTEITFDNVTVNLIMSSPPWELKGRGWVHHAKLMCGHSNDTVKSALIGKRLWDSEILGVEAFAIIWLPFGSPLGLLTKEKLW